MKPLPSTMTYAAAPDDSLCCLLRRFMALPSTMTYDAYSGDLCHCLLRKPMPLPPLMTNEAAASSDNLCRCLQQQMKLLPLLASHPCHRLVRFILSLLFSPHLVLVILSLASPFSTSFCPLLVLLLDWSLPSYHFVFSSSSPCCPLVISLLV